MVYLIYFKEDKAINKLLSNKIFKNAGWLVFSKIIQMMISLIVGIVTTRYLGPSNYGLINYASAYTAFFFALSTLGINSVIVKEIIDNPQSEGEVLGTAIFLKVIASIMSSLMILSVVSIVDKGEYETILVVAISCISIVCNAFDTFSYWFHAKLKAKCVAGCTFTAYVITSVYKIYLVVTGKNVCYFAFALSVDYLVLAIMLMCSYKLNGGQKISVSLKYARDIMSKSHHFILSGLMVSIYAQTDKLMLKGMMNSTEIGYYSTAVSLCNIWCFVLIAIIDSFYPSIVESYSEDKALFEKNNKILYAIVFYISIFVSVLFTVFSKFIICILYGKAYLPSSAPLRIITWYVAFSYLGVARNAWIVCENKQRYLKYIYLSSAIVNVVLNYFLIPEWGASGAAIASLITQVLTILVAPIFIKELKHNTKLIVDAIRLKGLR